MTATEVSAESIQPRESVAELLNRAKFHIETSDGCLQQAAEDIAAAKEQGATQRKIAETVGKSAAWVNRLLKWREAGYQDTAFGPQSKSKRARVSQKRSQRVQAPEQPSAIEMVFAADEREQRDAEARKVIVRLRKELPDHEDAMLLCDYVEWRLVEVPPYDLPEQAQTPCGLH